MLRSSFYVSLDSRPLREGLVSTVCACATSSPLSPKPAGRWSKRGLRSNYPRSHFSSSPSDGCWTLLADFSNAFNSIDRGSMFQEFRRHIPSLSPWIEACYSSQPNLLLGSHSCSGVQQGGPLGPLGFALTLQPIIDCIQSEVPGLALNAWYLDDGTLIGSPNDLLSALEIIEREGPRIGLHLNKAKSLLYIPAEADQSVNPLPSAVREGFSLLGCPVGPPDFCEASF